MAENVSRNRIIDGLYYDLWAIAVHFFAHDVPKNNSFMYYPRFFADAKLAAAGLVGCVACRYSFGR